MRTPLSKLPVECALAFAVANTVPHEIHLNWAGLCKLFESALQVRGRADVVKFSGLDHEHQRFS